MIHAEDILKEIKLPDYKGRHVFTAKLRLVIFLVFWVLSALFFEGVWTSAPFIPIAISFAFLLTGICYNNILKGRALVFSFISEILLDLFTITLIIYMTGGEKSNFFTIYIIYAIAAGTYYSNLIAMLASVFSFLFYGGLVLLRFYGVIDAFKPTPSEVLIFDSPSTAFFSNLALLAIFMPIVVYASKISNYFSRIKERALEDKNKQLIALNRISRTIKGLLSMDKAIRQVLSGVIEGLGYEICFLVIPSKVDNEISFHAPKNYAVTRKLEAIMGMPVSALRLPKVEENYVFQAIKKNKIIFRQQLYELVRGIQPPISPEVAATIQQALGFKKFIITPLVAERKVVGALIGASKNEFVDESSVDVLENFANQAALAIESAQLFEELRKKNKDLEQANKIKSEFLAIMSHELRTPLTAVIGFSELLMEEVMGELNGEQKEYLREVVVNSDHLLHLINSILDLSKVESGKMALNIESFDLTRLSKEVKSSVQPLLKKKGLKLELTILEELPMLVADERKMKQIMLNLISNSIKFTQEGGKISMQIAYFPYTKGSWLYPKKLNQENLSGGYFKMVVEDTGIGIRQKDLEKIFEPFSQVDSSYTRKYQGTGLGLALTKQFVEMHGGIIWAESELKQGSRFTVILPANSHELAEPEIIHQIQ